MKWGQFYRVGSISDSGVNFIKWGQFYREGPISDRVEDTSLRIQISDI